MRRLRRAARSSAGVPAKSSTKRAAKKKSAVPASPIQALKAAVKTGAGKNQTRKVRR